jgi:hypothetical protein
VVPSIPTFVAVSHNARATNAASGDGYCTQANRRRSRSAGANTSSLMMCAPVRPWLGVGAGSVVAVRSIAS